MTNEISDLKVAKVMIHVPFRSRKKHRIEKDSSANGETGTLDNRSCDQFAKYILKGTPGTALQRRSRNSLGHFYRAGSYLKEKRDIFDTLRMKYSLIKRSFIVLLIYVDVNIC